MVDCDNAINGKVVASFVVSECEEIKMLKKYVGTYTDYQLQNACIDMNEAKRYSKKKPLFAWHISQLKIFDRPKEIKDFVSVNKCNINCPLDAPYECKTKRCIQYCRITKAPQSYCYVEELNNG